MSGHSKWASIKRSKAANDSKRGQIFTKIGHEIAIAVREGGADPEANFRLRLVLEKARRANMPKDNIERAIKRGSGEGGSGNELAECIYEGYGPHGTAIIVEALTDNRNRTVSEIRHVFSRHGGNLGAEGCVAWMFSRKGYIAITPGDNDPEEIALVAIDAGAEDVEINEDLVEVYTPMDQFKAVQENLQDASYEITNAQLSWVPQSNITLGEKETIQNMKLLELLEDLDDVQEVYSNLEIGDETIAKYESAA
ncbi:MAG TPA: YebC/PmpR family DNA-binding transcriptional regulator [Chloroflexi bacterium]|jgi:YebC/PmpR family DNA-binding regulatory protein|nr:YebC/PmpR family DNA-binding transcriptional regulator [Chloroflexota bacterium]